MALDYPYALTPDRYREVLATDFTRMRSLVERAGTADVVECPGWTGQDAVRHTAEVYAHKVQCIRTQQRPAEWPPAGLEDLAPADVLDQTWLDLNAEFDEHRPDDPAYTWWPSDQSVGFWIRRMAHETSIHRRDVESAAGDRTPVEEDLAVDGIDEVLELFLSGDWEDEAVDSASGRTVAVESGGHRWAVTLNPQIVDLERDGAAEAVATVSGGPSDVLLWLWGRGPLPAVAGDEDAVRELRARLALATE